MSPAPTGQGRRRWRSAAIAADPVHITGRAAARRSLKPDADGWVTELQTELPGMPDGMGVGYQNVVAAVLPGAMVPCVCSVLRAATGRAVRGPRSARMPS